MQLSARPHAKSDNALPTAMCCGDSLRSSYIVPHACTYSFPRLYILFHHHLGCRPRTFTTGYEPCSRSLTSRNDNDAYSAYTSCRELAAALEKTPSHVRAVHPLALASWTPKTILSYEKGFIGGQCTAAQCRTLGRGPGPVNSSNNSRTHDDYDSGLRVCAFTTVSLINTHTFAAILGDAPVQPLYNFNFLRPSNDLRVTPDKHPHTPTISAHIATRFERFLAPSVESYTVSISSPLRLFPRHSGALFSGTCFSS